MAKLICSHCKIVFDQKVHESCPYCGRKTTFYNFQNSDERLKQEAGEIQELRKKIGLEGLTGGLEALIINTEPDKQKAAVRELLQYTELEVVDVFEDTDFKTCVLKTANSADFLVRSRKNSSNPFRAFNDYPKSRGFPHTRLETFVFNTSDLKEYVKLQKSQGVKFLCDSIIETNHYYFIQTVPSPFTGLSYGVIQWKGKKGNYRTAESHSLDWIFQKPDKAYLKNIKWIDHAATRVRAEDRDDAILEFMRLTNYNFEFAIYVKFLNSITNVARITDKDFAMVFTSGIKKYENEKNSGPTEKFIYNYGTRVHHLAFHTENIDETYKNLKQDGMGFLIELVGSPEQGLKQTFTQASENTLLVNEYIHRFGDFDGFFTKNNVTELTRATEKQ